MSQDAGVSDGGGGDKGGGAADGGGTSEDGKKQGGADGGDQLQRAVNELYSGDPDDFMSRRTALAADAKQAGAKLLAKQIGALRKPSKSAAILNRLARQDPDGMTQLGELGEDLRQAERSVDAAQIRDLNSQRRKLLDTLTKRAFDISDEDSPTSALREEITSTLTAALADPSVAEQLAAGTLIKSASWEGFSFGGPPDLSVVPNRAEPAPRPKAAPTPAVPRGASKAERDEAKKAAEDERREQAAAAAKEAKQAALEDARKAVDDADEAVELAAAEEQVRLERLQELQEQVDEARKAVDEARIQLRRAEIRRRRVGETLQRLER